MMPLPFKSRTSKPSSAATQPVAVRMPSRLWSNRLPAKPAAAMVSMPSPSKSRVSGSYWWYLPSRFNPNHSLAQSGIPPSQPPVLSYSQPKNGSKAGTLGSNPNFSPTPKASHAALIPKPIDAPTAIEAQKGNVTPAKLAIAPAAATANIPPKIEEPVLAILLALFEYRASPICNAAKAFPKFFSAA